MSFFRTNDPIAHENTKKVTFLQEMTKNITFFMEMTKKVTFLQEMTKKSTFFMKKRQILMKTQKKSLFWTRPFQNDFFSAFFHSRPLFFRNFQKSSESCSKRFFYKKGPIGFPYNSPHKTHFSIENHFFVGFSLSSFSEVFSGQLAPLLPDSKKNTKKITFFDPFLRKRDKYS